MSRRGRWWAYLWVQLVGFVGAFRTAYQTATERARAEEHRAAEQRRRDRHTAAEGQRWEAWLASRRQPVRVTCATQDLAERKTQEALTKYGLRDQASPEWKRRHDN